MQCVLYCGRLLCCFGQHGTMLHYVVLCCPRALYGSVACGILCDVVRDPAVLLCSRLLWRTVLHYPVLSCTVLYCTVLYFVVVGCARIYCRGLCCMWLFFTGLCCSVLHHVFVLNRKTCILVQQEDRSSWWARRHVLVLSKNACILVRQENMSSCLTRRHVFLRGKNTCPLAQQEDIVFLLDKGTCLLVWTRRHVFLPIWTPNG